jgi:hypothetical protein
MLANDCATGERQMMAKLIDRERAVVLTGSCTPR